MNFRQKFNFPKIAYNSGETLLVMREQMILSKNIFSTKFEIVQNFHYFCKVRAG